MARLIDTVAWVCLAGGRILGTRTRGRELFYIPGGKRHPGESDTETLVREVREEVSVALLPGTLAHVGTYRAAADGHGADAVVRMACYTAEYRGTLAASSEIEELAWLGYSDRDRTAPVDRVVFDDLRAAGLLR
ncbi:NUDIX hydrolase [Streptomyces aidingensis]|uniref:8-oxo-dGTP pyrophosphatase MutT, NUDIX family n=1 Tax=Streptomyces aidingensis TaxID=910347 RepID=A0A1I1P8V9_9ACTN|nr:NUDIX domain-containing protein [Streptomyces aidingensis]SFD06344.1 8-oxo-dGTP pyrophosphatase MutT, NUDIX family [Streptomyces aidingensis]